MLVVITALGKRANLDLDFMLKLNVNRTGSLSFTHASRCEHRHGNRDHTGLRTPFIQVINPHRSVQFHSVHLYFYHDFPH